ncbi:IclR family transcriptional regulator [Rhodococcus sp. SGAir0479]|nr:IclR family transcriptional regulator [Rhodococcus sp. SGAir0479]
MLDRVELILEAVDDNGYLTNSQAARLTGIPRSTAHRLLEKMVAMRWLKRIDTRYELGVRLFELGSRAIRDHWFHSLCLPIMQELHRSTGAVVHLAYLDGIDSVYWEKLSGAFGANVPSRIGSRYPAHRSAVGKALLSRLRPEAIDDPMFDHLDHGVPGGRAALRTELEQTRSHGIAFDRGIAAPSLGCVGAPVTAGIPEPAAISICGPVERITTDRRMIDAVQRAAAAIERAASRDDVSGRVDAPDRPPRPRA